MDKQKAMDLFEVRRKEVLEFARWCAKRYFKEHGNVTIDDVRQYVTLPEGVNAKVFGAVFNDEGWEQIGYVKTKRETSHGRVVGCWRYTRDLSNFKVEYNQPSLF